MAPNADILANMYHVNGGYIGDLGRQDSEYDDALAENAEMTPMMRQKEISLLTLALCIILPGGLFVLAGLALRRYLKG
jgi:predicted methyltransferase MtxX (methanogen marker protein 4)